MRTSTKRIETAIESRRVRGTPVRNAHVRPTPQGAAAPRRRRPLGESPVLQRRTAAPDAVGKG